MATALVVFANGSEDMEVTSIASILDRGGVKVVRAAVAEDGACDVVLSHGMQMHCDCNIKDCVNEKFDLIAIPGGLKGSQNCAHCTPLIKMLKAQKAEGRYIAGICAAPGFVLEAHGLIGEAQATGYPGCSDNIKHYCKDGTCIDEAHHLVTGKGPAYSIDFGLACLSVLVPAVALEQVKAGMLY